MEEWEADKDVSEKGKGEVGKEPRFPAVNKRTKMQTKNAANILNLPFIPDLLKSTSYTLPNTHTMFWLFSFDTTAVTWRRWGGHVEAGSCLF